MNREQAERLLAALIFDDLDETSKAELVAYLQTDDELRDRLADLRMAVKLADDAVNEGPDPVLSERRLKQLQRLPKTGRARVRAFPMGPLAVAAVLMFILVLVGPLSMFRRMGASRVPSKRPISQPMTAPVPAASRPATRGSPSDLPASAGRSYSKGVGELRYTTDDVAADHYDARGMGGYGGAGGMSGREIVNSPYNGPAPSNGVQAGKEILGQQVGQSDARTREELRSLSSREVLAGALARARRNGSAPQEQEREAAKMPAGNADGDGLRLNEDLGKKTAGVATDEMKEQASSFRSGRGNVAAETLGRYSGVVNHGWSGKVAFEKPAVPMATPAPSESDVAFDRELNRGLGIKGSVKDDKSVPVLGDVPIVGGLSRGSPAGKQAISGKIEELGEKELAEQKRAEAAKAQSELRSQAETDRQGRINELMARTKAYWKQQQYEAALGQLEALLAIDPLNDEALTNKQMVQDMINLRKQTGLDVVVAQDASGVPVQSHFKVVPVNPWVMTERDAFSTFGLDVDTASYALCRRYIRGGYLPPVGAIRMEEFVNAFDYAYPQRDDATFAVHAEGAPSPFAPAGQDLVLLKVAVKARTVGRDQRRPTNLIFVVDASASMGQADRLPLVQSISNQLVDKLSEADRVSLITCANEARLHLEAVSARQKDTIHQTINAIQPAGPTNLLAGLKLGYEMARKSFVAGQTNQVVLCSDGVANVGQTEAEAMLKEVAEDRKQAITLTCVGVGYGAYNDAFLEALADQGDGRYVFLDSSEQAQEALVGQLAGSLQNVATDARIQVQFNPAQVRRYRLVGYENRDIEDQRFRDDTVEAGAVGSGQCSTALYEMELTGPSSGVSEADLGTVFVRYRNTDTGQIEEISRPLANSLIRRRSVEDDPRFFLAAGAARFAEWLRQSEHAQQTSLADVQRLLDRVSADLPLDRQVQNLALLAHQAEGLPRAPETPETKP